MYVVGNPRSKTALKEMVKSGRYPEIFSPGPFPPTQNGKETVEGPQGPGGHDWYALVEVEDGRIVKILK